MFSFLRHGCLFALLFVLAPAATAVEVIVSKIDLSPQIPAEKVDAKIFATESPKDFFEKRRSHPQRGERDAARANYRGLRLELQSLAEKFQREFPLPKGAKLPGYGAARSALLVKENATNTAFKKWRDLEKVAGDCVVTATAHPTFRLENETRQQSWSSADGSCFLSEATAATTRQKFEYRVQSLLNIPSYCPPHHEGFSNMIAFVPVDHDSGEISTSTEIATPEAHAFIAVLTPIRLGGFGVAGTYYVKNVVTPFAAASDKEWQLKFESTTNSAFAPPRLKQKQVTGEFVKFGSFPLPASRGMWYLSEDGYVRYFTAGDFHGAPEGFAAEEAERVLLETLLQLSERPHQEAP